MHRSDSILRIIGLVLLFAIASAAPTMAQVKEAKEIRAVVDQFIRDRSSMDPSAIQRRATTFSSSAGTVYYPFGEAPVAQILANTMQGLEKVTSRSFEATTPIRINASKKTGWAVFGWRAERHLKDGSHQKMEGRTTLIFAREAKKWKILHAHSSVPAALPATASAREADADGILDIERSIWEAFRKGDLTPIEQYFSEDVSVLEGASAYRMSGKVDVLRAYRALLKNVKIENYQILDPKVNVHGGTAVLSYYYTESLRTQGMPVTESGKITTVYAREDGEWRVVHHHSSVNVPEGGHGVSH